MKDQKIIIIAVIAIIAVIGVIGAYWGFANSNINDGTVKDMAGRNVNLPSEINKTYSTAGSTTILLYMLAPDKMIGWNAINGTNHYMPAQYQKLPVLGGGQGQGQQTANYETIISNNPDLVFVGHGGDNDTIDRIQQKFGQIPVLDVEGDNNLTNIIPSIKFMGTILGNQNQSDEIVNFYENVLNQVNSTVSTIPDSREKEGILCT